MNFKVDTSLPEHLVRAVESDIFEVSVSEFAFHGSYIILHIVMERRIAFDRIELRRAYSAKIWDCL